MMTLSGLALIAVGIARLRTAKEMFSVLTGFYAVVAGLIAVSIGFVIVAAAG